MKTHFQDHYLRKLLIPQSVALFGASARSDSVGGIVFSNLIQEPFQGKVFGINPKHDRIGDVKTFKDLDSTKSEIDLAVIATPAPTVPEIVEQCGHHGIRSVLIISAGFRETGEEGRRREEHVLKVARSYGIRFVGPNCLGLMRPKIGLNATFYRGRSIPGRVALVSQSGAICTAILDWAESNGVGFSSVVSVGIAADVDVGEILDFLTSDPETESILLYLEGVDHARKFMSGLRAAARMKPIVVLKAGRFESGAHAAVSHTGAMIGNDEVFDAAIRRAGVVRVDTTAQLFEAAEAFSAGRMPSGDRLVVITNGGGLGVLAADAASSLNIPLSELSKESMAKLNEKLPAAWSHGNPVDILGDASPERYREALSICVADPSVDGVLAMLSPQAMTAPLDVAKSVIDEARKTQKPIFVCWMGGTQTSVAHASFAEAQIPCFDSPVAGVEAFAYLVAYRKNQKMLLQTPGPLSDSRPPDVKGARLLIEAATDNGRRVLTMLESKALLAAFRIPVTPALMARSAHEALVNAESLGFPVAMKIHSETLTHKTEIRGVRLNISDAESVRGTFADMMSNVERLGLKDQVGGITVERMMVSPHQREVMIGVKRDPAFGPVISFGLGGTMAELIGDHRVALPPLSEVIIERLISETRASKLLGKFRNLPPARQEDLYQILIRVSEMVCELPMIYEMDLNPVLVSDQGAIVVDARVICGPEKEGVLPYAHLAIHPYPSGLVRKWQMADGTEVTLRPIRPEDAEIEKNFDARLSAGSKYFRFMGTLHELTPELLVRFTQIDYDREMAFVATILRDGKELQVGVGRYVVHPDGDVCEFAIVVADDWQHRGIATQIMEDLMRVARNRGVKTMKGEILRENQGMLAFVERLGFTTSPKRGDSTLVEATKAL